MLKIITIADRESEELKKECLPVIINEENKERFKQIFSDFIELLKSIPTAFGFSANQVGLPLAVIAVNWGKLKGAKEDNFDILINPTIDKHSDESFHEITEGCLSVPETFLKTNRYKEITYSYQNLEGERMTKTAVGLESVFIQHEIDHLNGKLFIDTFPRQVRKEAMKLAERAKNRKLNKR